MDKHTLDFLETARAGEPVYITDVRNRYLELGDRDSVAIDLMLELVGGGERLFELRFPRFTDYPEDGKRFVVDFFLATAYNILSSLGGRGLTLIASDDGVEARTLLHSFEKAFGIDLPSHERQGYGRCLNVIDRMLPAISSGSAGEWKRFSISVSTDRRRPAPIPQKSTGKAADLFRKAAGNLDGKAILGIDIGGTDIKLALAINDKLICCKEYDWFPALFTRMDQLLDPILVLAHLMAVAAAAHSHAKGAAIKAAIEPAMRKDADVAVMRAALSRVDAEIGDLGFLFDAIGVCFPDVVLGDKIVGGETLKTRGIRAATGADYDREYAKLTDLDAMLAAYVKADGAVGIVNDGPMAAFAAGVEAAFADPEAVADGVFAHTLGTELGTGWVDETGTIPDIPLEVYNFIVDLGSFPERDYEPDDLRSLNNFNTRLPGTLQKIGSQSGVFRLALKYFPTLRPGLFEDLWDKGFVVERDVGGEKGLYVPSEPKDLRKPFLEHMMSLAESENDPVVNRVFEEIGVGLAVCGREVDWILQPKARLRTLFGRLVKRAVCFDLMKKGALSYDQDADLAVADDGIAETPLMKELSRSRDYTIAQFAQAVGAIHYVNCRLG